MQLTTTHKTVLGFSAALLILIVVSSIGYRTANTVGETNGLVTRTQGVLLLTDGLRSQVATAQSAVADFAQTGNEASLDRYLTAARLIRESLKLLDTLTSDRPSFAYRITSLRAEVTAQLPRIEAKIRSGRGEAPEALLDESRTFFERVRSEIQAIERGELSFLSSHSATEDVHARRTKYSIVLGSLGAVGFFILATVVIVGDLRGRHRAEEKLRASEQRFRTLADNAPVGIFLTDSEGRCELVNDQYTRITGLTSEEAAGDGWQNLLHPGDREKVSRRWSTTTNEGRKGSMLEYRFVRPDGRVVWVFGRSAPLLDPRGRVAGFVGTIADISDRKLAEMERDQFFNLSLDMLSIGDIRGGRFRRLNPAWRHTLGFTLDELMAEPFMDFVHPEDRAATQRQAARLAEGAETVRFENRCRRKDGSYRWLSWSAVPDRDRKLIYATARDVTESRRLEEELKSKNVELERQNIRVERATRLKSEFLANMSHELRTPLNGIIGFAELMRDGRVGPVSEQHAEFLDDILTSSRHLLQLINDILDLSKVEAGRMEFRPEEFELEAVVMEVRHIVRELAATKQVNIDIDIDPGLDVVRLDPAKLKQVLYNYLSNALKFTENGRVVVRCLIRSQGTFRLEVEDSGIGIRSQDIGKLFTEFQQLDQGTAKRYQGTGLGLALTKRIVEAQGGTVGVTSQWGRGSTFYAILPVRYEADSAPESLPESPSCAQEGPKVLIVDDDLHDAERIAKILADRGFQPRHAATGAGAIALAMEESFDAVTLDLLLPDMNGWEALRQIRASELNAGVPAIAVTGVRDRAAVESPGIQGFVSKPVNGENLLGALALAGIEGRLEEPVGS